MLMAKSKEVTTEIINAEYESAMQITQELENENNEMKHDGERKMTLKNETMGITIQKPSTNEEAGIAKDDNTEEEYKRNGSVHKNNRTLAREDAVEQKNIRHDMWQPENTCNKRSVWTAQQNEELNNERKNVKMEQRLQMRYGAYKIRSGQRPWTRYQECKIRSGRRPWTKYKHHKIRSGLSPSRRYQRNKSV